jgi:hypothetical protein
MAVLGAVLKNTAKLGSLYVEKKRRGYIQQHQVLSKHVLKAKFTDFGKAHYFSELIKQGDLRINFARYVPLTDYSSFHQKWLYRVIEGEQNVIWPGKIKYFALSSGTSGAPSKRIPVSSAMIKSFQRVSLKQLLTLHEYGLKSDFYEKSMLIIGGSTKLKKHGFAKEGDLSGILSGKIPFWFSKFSKPEKRIRKLANWEEKLEEIILHAPSWDIGVISGVPAWVEMVLKAIIERYSLRTIHEIWPSLRVYVHGGVSIDPYREELIKCFGKKVFFQETYLASEGYFAYQKGKTDVGMQLLLNAGVYYEFIPFNSTHFDSDGQLNPNAEAIPLHSAEEGVDYALVVSTCSGLWRYVIGDTIRFTNLKNYELEITGRIAHYLNVCGEHLSVANMNDAMKRTGELLGVTVIEFSGYAKTKGFVQHVWYVGVDYAVSDEQFAMVLDQTFAQINDDYAAVRMRKLNMPQVKQLPRERFTEFLALQGKLGGQHKFPRILKGEQLKKWKLFIDED